ncbi:DNA-3-methyladenine glycosylase [Bacteroidota bacterium]
MKDRLPLDFYTHDVLKVAPALIGKELVLIAPEGIISKHLITETEAYRGSEDKACHASKGRTARTEVMFHQGGVLYMYLIYGMYWMLNIVTAVNDIPQAVLIRSLKHVKGPGRLTRELHLDSSYNWEDLVKSERIFIINTGIQCNYTAHPRIGIDYAGKYWSQKPWRYVLEE